MDKKQDTQETLTVETFTALVTQELALTEPPAMTDVLYNKPAGKDCLHVPSLSANQVDSLDLIELAMALEDKYSIDIADDELTKTTTLGELYELVKAKVVAKVQPETGGPAC